MLDLVANQLGIKMQIITNLFMVAVLLEFIEYLVIEDCVESQFVFLQLSLFGNKIKKLLNRHLSIQSYSAM
jgi:hypothetical protein